MSLFTQRNGISISLYPTSLLPHTRILFVYFCQYYWTKFGALENTFLRQHFWKTTWLFRFVSSLEKTIYSKGINVSAAIYSSFADILTCKSFLYHFWPCHGNHQIPCRSGQKSVSFLHNSVVIFLVLFIE